LRTDIDEADGMFTNREFDFFKVAFTVVESVGHIVVDVEDHVAAPNLALYSVLKAKNRRGDCCDLELEENFDDIAVAIPRRNVVALKNPSFSTTISRAASSHIRKFILSEPVADIDTGFGFFTRIAFGATFIQLTRRCRTRGTSHALVIGVVVHARITSRTAHGFLGRKIGVSVIALSSFDPVPTLNTRVAARCAV